jgi:VanZ family protein
MPAGRISRIRLAALIGCLALLVYGSLSPWQGWRSLGVGPFAFLFAPWPTHITAFDLALNILAYLPLGLLLLLALRPRLRPLPALAVAVTAAAALSIAIEALQSYLPARIASNLDVLTNVAGACLGALAGSTLAPLLIEGGGVREVRRRWFLPHADLVLLLAFLWPLAQLQPGAMLFGNGELGQSVVGAILSVFDRSPPMFDPGQFAAAEVVATACGMLAAGAALVSAMRAQAPRRRLLGLLIGSALATKALIYGYEFGAVRAFAWLTPGAVAGLAVGLLAVTATASASTARTATLISIAAVIVLVFAVNAVAPNPYHAHWLSAWNPGRLRDAIAVSDLLAVAWPFAMLIALFITNWRGGRQPRRPMPPGGHPGTRS